MSLLTDEEVKEIRLSIPAVCHHADLIRHTEKFIEAKFSALRADSEALKQQVEQGKRDAEISRRVVELYERIETPFDKILTSDQRAFLFDNEYELKYIPMYADPTYIKEWFWEIRDKHGASVAPASVWLYTAINVAMTKAAIAAAPKQEK